MSKPTLNVQRVVAAYPAMISVLPEGIRVSIQSQLNVAIELLAREDTAVAAEYMFEQRREVVKAMLSVDGVKDLPEVVSFTLAAGMRDLEDQTPDAPPVVVVDEAIVMAPVAPATGTVVVDEDTPPQVDVSAASASVDISKATPEEVNLMTRILESMKVVAGARDGHVRFDLPQLVYIDMRAAAAGNVSNVYKDVQPEPSMMDRVQQSLAQAVDQLGIDAKTLGSVVDSLSASQASKRGPSVGSALLGAVGNILSGDKVQAVTRLGEAAVHGVAQRVKQGAGTPESATANGDTRARQLIHAAYLSNTDKAAWKAYVTEQQLVPPGLPDDIALQVFNVLLKNY